MSWLIAIASLVLVVTLTGIIRVWCSFQANKYTITQLEYREHAMLWIATVERDRVSQSAAGSTYRKAVRLAKSKWRVKRRIGKQKDIAMRIVRKSNAD